MDVLVSPAELIRGMPAEIRITAYDGSAIVDPGTVTVTVTRHDGTTLWSGAASGIGTAPRTVALSEADLGSLDFLSITATSSVFGQVSAHVPVVGAPLFWIAEARRFDQGQLADEVRYPDDLLIAVRARVREAFTSVTGQRFVPELVAVTLDAAGGDTLLLPDVRVTRIRSAAIRNGASWQALSDDDLANLVIAEPGLFIWTRGTWPEGRGVVRLAYECGWPQPPAEIRRAALRVAASYMGMLPSNLPDRALTLSDELGTFRLATPGVGGSWFGLPEVDAVLQRYRASIPGVA